MPEEPARTRVSGAMTMRLASSIFPRVTGEKSDEPESEVLTVMCFFLFCDAEGNGMKVCAAGGPRCPGGGADAVLGQARAR